jgi:hypothetical protein
MDMKIRASVCSPDRISLEMSDINGSMVSFQLDAHEALGLMAAVTQAVNALPSAPTAPLHQQRAFLKSQNPSFQVGVKPGAVVLAIKPTSFPSLEFEFDAEMLSKLISDLRTAANVPSQTSTRSN